MQVFKTRQDAATTVSLAGALSTALCDCRVGQGGGFRGRWLKLQYLCSGIFLTAVRLRPGPWQAPKSQKSHRTCTTEKNELKFRFDFSTSAMCEGLFFMAFISVFL